MQGHRIYMFNHNDGGPDTGRLTFEIGNQYGFPDNLYGTVGEASWGPVRFDYETRPGSTSLYYGIKY
jgi:hypothetical protein